MTDHLNSSPLDNVRLSVKNSTRFEPGDIEGLGHNEFLQNFDIIVDYELDANINTSSINGSFSAQYNDEEVYSPSEAAARDIGPRLNEAHKDLVYSLASPNRAYNAIKPGLYLPAQKRYWHLESCGSCYGRGKTTCTTCHGQRDVTCPSCHGTCRTQCDTYGCVGGRVLCYSCGGTGQTARQVSYTNYGSNGPVTEYRTEYVPCTAGCQHGYKQCTSCFGTGYVSCRTCNMSGRVQCSTCRGMGEIDCTTCDATGKVGQLAQTDVSIAVDYSLGLPADTPDDARGIADKEGCHGLASQASSLAPVPDGVTTETFGNVRARYAGQILLCRDDVRCNARDFHIVAYGNEMKWWTLDNILEYLLRSDLEALKQANVTAKQEGWLSINLEPVLLPLRNVIASELNAELVESALGQKEAQHVDHQAVSADYAQEVQRELLETLRLVYTRSAKKVTWVVLGATLLTGLVTWWLAGRWWAVLALVAGAFLGGRVLDYGVRGLLRKTFPTTTMADRAISLAQQSGKGGQGKWLVRIPPILALIYVAISSYEIIKGTVIATPPESVAIHRDVVTRAAATQPGQVFRDCEGCPEMVVIPPGSFKMGSDEESAHEQPVHEVEVASFALAKNEVTVGEFGRFIRATNYRTTAQRPGGTCRSLKSNGEWVERRDRRWDKPGFEQDRAHPVTCVSWDDARAYVQWLSKTTGQNYRLPSEAEWEYAARAGNEGRRPWRWSLWGTAACWHANVPDETPDKSGKPWKGPIACQDGYFFTAPVGSYVGNVFGLHDMIGNVEEWTGDCQHDDYQNAPSTGQARVKDGDCKLRIIRGGGYTSSEERHTYSRRDWRETEKSTAYLGFRPVSELSTNANNK